MKIINLNFKLFIYLSLGVLASICWIGLFVAGLLVNSEYYRAAVSHGFADFYDWLGTVLTFTLSNVSILAFFAGLIGGICSLITSTKGFTLNKTEIENKIIEGKLSPEQLENPLISSFRGIFVFVAVLSLQYLSSFNDLGTISKNSEQLKNQSIISLDEIYSKLGLKLKDSVTLQTIKELLEKQSTEFRQTENEALISQAILLRDSIKNESGILKREKLKHNLFMLRRKIKSPPDVDFSGIGFSTFAYFKFAVIVSFLSFIFGYSPKLFYDFISKIFKPN